MRAAGISQRFAQIDTDQTTQAKVPNRRDSANDRFGSPFLIRVYPCKSVADFSSCLATARPGVHAGERREAAGRSKEGSAVQLEKKKVANLRARG